MEQNPHILIVDDHAEIRELLAEFLGKHSLRVSLADSAAEARKLMKTQAFDLLVLDVMMPGEDGLSLCRDVRATHDIPVILLTAMAEETDRIIGLEIGADDYVTKPFNPRELLARIRAVVRRTHSLPPSQSPEPGIRYGFDGWHLNVDRRELTDPDGVSVPLSTTEFQLLLVFLERPHIVLNRDQLLDLTKGRASEVFDRSIDNQVSRLRKKIEADPKAPRFIQTVWGGGYKLSCDVTRD